MLPIRHCFDGGRPCLAALRAPDRVWQEKPGDGRQRKFLSSAYVRQPGSPAQQPLDVNASKPNGRQTDDHTPLLTQHISACQTRLRGLREVRVAEQEQTGSLSVLLTTKWMSRYFREPHFSLLSFMNTSCSTTWNSPKAPLMLGSYSIYYEHMSAVQLNISWWVNINFCFFLRPIISLQSISAPTSKRDESISKWANLARSFVAAVRLGAESDPRVNINTAFLERRFHYWTQAWWTRLLPLWRGRVSTERKEGRWKDEERGYGISRMKKWAEGMRECEWGRLQRGRKEKTSD